MGRENRTTIMHRFNCGQTKSFVQRWIHQINGALIEREQSRIRSRHGLYSISNKLRAGAGRRAGSASYTSDQRWAEPDLQDAVRAMQSVVSQPTAACELAGGLKTFVNQRFSSEAIASSAFSPRLPSPCQERPPGHRCTGWMPARHENYGLKRATVVMQPGRLPEIPSPPLRCSSGSSVSVLSRFEPRCVRNKTARQAATALSPRLTDKRTVGSL